MMSVNLPPAEIATIRGKGAWGVKNGAAAQNATWLQGRPCGPVTPPDAGPRLSDGWPGPPPGGTGGRIGRLSPATTRLKPEFDITAKAAISTPKSPASDSRRSRIQVLR